MVAMLMPEETCISISLVNQFNRKNDESYALSVSYLFSESADLVLIDLSLGGLR